MPFLIALLTATCSAEDGAATVPADTAHAQQQVADVAQRVEEVADRLTAIERFLADEILVSEGKAPKGWVQPSIEDYMKPGAPVSMIPVPPKPPTLAPRVPYGPQP